MTNQTELTYKPHEEYPWIWTPPIPVIHDDNQYDSSGHEQLLKMQQKHFWYRGRHRFLLKATKLFGLNHFPEDSSPSVIDLGGGCGGWVQYLSKKNIWPNCELALSDSSVNALTMAREKLPPDISCYQTDLLKLQWSERWGIAYMLDILEHLPDPLRALKEIHKSLRPGGLLILTVPALQFFWSFVDEFGHHQKRYHQSDFKPLADMTGFEILDNRYFMFF